MRRTPQALGKLIAQFGYGITSKPLRLAVHRPEDWAKPVNCFNNVDQKVELDGGTKTCGWMFNERLVEAIPGGNFLIAINHVAWTSPDGRLVDVTPFHTDPSTARLGRSQGRFGSCPMTVLCRPRLPSRRGSIP